MEEKKIHPMIIQNILKASQDETLVKLNNARIKYGNAVAKGGVTESIWKGWLMNSLPDRYKVNDAANTFVIDSDGNVSNQIDIIIYDQNYSYLIFHDKNDIGEVVATYIPAESVYAVIEVKQDLSRRWFEDAGEKIASVRKLKRTSVPVTTINGESKAKPLHRILGGILALESWKSDETLETNLRRLSEEQQIDFGCALSVGSFWAEYSPNFKLSKSAEDETLMFLFFMLLMRLQSIGTVPAIDIPAYAKFLKSFNP